MKYKYIAVDVDGTLLNSKGLITDATKKAVDLCKRKGVIFSICTGRPIQGIKNIVKELNIDTPSIIYNGAMVVLGQSGEILYEKKLGCENTKKVISFGENFETTIIVWAQNVLYANKDNERVKKYGKLVSESAIIVDDFKDIITDGVSKVLFYDDIDRINSFEKLAIELGKEEINFHTSKPMFLEFVDKNASKSIAMEKIGEYLNISKSEMIAIGDGFNDLSMIEYAGLGIVMGNADKAIKAKADFITKSNDEDGLAFAINKFVG